MFGFSGFKLTSQTVPKIIEIFVFCIVYLISLYFYRALKLFNFFYLLIFRERDGERGGETETEKET